MTYDPHKPWRDPAPAKVEADPDWIEEEPGWSAWMICTFVSVWALALVSVVVAGIC